LAPLFYFPRWYLNLTTCVNNLHYEKFQDGTVKCIEDEIPFEVPEGWEWCRYSDVIELYSGQDLTPDRYNDTGDGIPYITGASNLEQGKVLINRWTTTPTTHATIGDLLLTVKGSGVGKMAFCDITDAHIARQIMALRCTTAVHPHYLYIAISAMLDKITAQANGIIPGIRREIVLSALLPLPPSSEQTKICEKANNTLLIINTIVDEKEDLHTLISTAKSKILDLAIRGKLVPQNPDDEPASVLIERIRAEKEELIKQGKIKRNKKESVIFKGDDNSYYLRTESKAIEITNELPYKIPDSWEWAKIGDIFQVNPRNKIEDLLEVSFIPMPLIDDGFSGKHTSEERVWRKVKSGFTHFMEGDIGIAKITPCFENRKSVIFKNLKNGYGAGTTELHILRPYESTILPEYVLAYVKSSMFISKGKQEFTGAVGQQRIGKDYLENSYFPIPPLEEQVRIVEQISTVYKQLNMISDASLV